ncbi:hypothetical protein HOY34_07560 [Xinfangfangia sp. D13-10-4-6]|uniref:hypothetical protein n=1 Tax=Pseudogemmobacter hezensis TaxID=2737662 RepID=UPI0015562504|nr:hypothetical protein [Pseudogemmobacter hezensis]NPD15059.1 hypothetical protein [Pseudogemmobacter hezensis]
MDLAFFFRQRADFIASFYDTGSQAFTSRINGIEEEVPPWDDLPPGFDPEAGEPPYMEEWTDATDGLQMLGQAAVSLLSDALKMYLEGLRRHGEVDLDASDKRTAKERGFIRAYIAALSRRYGLDPEDQSRAIDMIEQVVLARNLSQHGSNLTMLSEQHPARDLERFPSMIFASEAEEKLWRENETGLSFMRPRLRIDAANLKAALGASIAFVDWVDAAVARKQTIDPMS